MGTKVIDLGKEVQIDLESGCWCSAISQYQVNFKGSLIAIEKTLQSALESVRNANGSR